MAGIIARGANIIMVLGLAIAILSAVTVRFTVGDEEERRRYYHMAGALGFGASLLSSAELAFANIARLKSCILYIVIVVISMYGLLKNIERYRQDT